MALARPDRRLGGRRHSRDAGRRRERRCWCRPTTPARSPRRSIGLLRDEPAPARDRRARRYARLDTHVHARRLRARDVRRLRRGGRATGGRERAGRPSSCRPTTARSTLARERREPARAGRASTSRWWWSTTARPTTRAARARGARRPAAARRSRIAARRRRGGAQRRHRGERARRFVAFHDSDDTALPGRLAVPVEFLGAHPDVDLVIQNGRMLPPEDDPTGAGGAVDPRRRWRATLAARPIGVAEVFRWNLGQLQGMCFRRRALDAVGPLDGAFRILDDLDLVLRVTRRASGPSSSTCRRSPTAAMPAASRATATRSARSRSASPTSSCAEHPEVLARARPRRRSARARRGAGRGSRATRARAGDAAGARAARSRRARALAPAQPALSPARALAARCAPGRADADRVHAPAASPAAARRPTSGAWPSGLAARGHDVHVFCARGATTRRPASPCAACRIVRGGRLVRLLVVRASRRRARSRASRWDVVVGFGRTPRQDVVRVGGGTHRSVPRRAWRRPGCARAARGPYHRAILWLERRMFAPAGHRRVLAVSRSRRDEVGARLRRAARAHRAWSTTASTSSASIPAGAPELGAGAARRARHRRRRAASARRSARGFGARASTCCSRSGARRRRRARRSCWSATTSASRAGAAQAAEPPLAGRVVVTGPRARRRGGARRGRRGVRAVAAGGVRQRRARGLRGRRAGGHEPARRRRRAARRRRSAALVVDDPEDLDALARRARRARSGRSARRSARRRARLAEALPVGRGTSTRVEALLEETARGR